MKSSCLFFFNHLGMPTLQNSTQFSNVCSLISVVQRVRVTVRLAVYRQSVHLGAEPLETHGQKFFFLNGTPAVIVLI
jgi:hypothetical protein